MPRSNRRRCFYSNCSHSQPRNKCRFHIFPKNPIVTQQWLNRSGLHKLTPKRVTQYMYICSCHFPESGQSKDNCYPLEYVEEYGKDEVPSGSENVFDVSGEAVFSTPATIFDGKDITSEPTPTQPLTSINKNEASFKKTKIESATPSSKQAAETLAAIATLHARQKSPGMKASYTPKKVMWKLRAAQARSTRRNVMAELLDTSALQVSELPSNANVLEETSNAAAPSYSSFDKTLQAKACNNDGENLKPSLQRQSTMLSADGDNREDPCTGGSQSSISSVGKLSPTKRVPEDVVKKRSIGIQCKRSFISYDTCKLLSTKDFKFYTGVTQRIFEILYEFLGGDEVCYCLKYQYSYATPKRLKICEDMTPKDKLLMTLLRLRRGIPLRDLGQIFSISTEWTSRCFYTWIRFMSIQFSKLEKHMFVSAADQEEGKPKCFSKFKNLRVIIDSTHFTIQKPINFQQQSNTFSDYKSSNTIVFLVGISCFGGLSFISDGYEGSISDRNLMVKSGFLNNLMQDDVVMADRGFDVEDIFNDIGVDLVIPAFLGERSGFTARELIGSKLIAPARIHVEGFIGRVKEFRLVRYCIPNTILSYASDVVKVCAYLVNFHEPYIALD